MKARRRGRVILDRWQDSLDEYNTDTITRVDSMIVIWHSMPFYSEHWITVHSAHYRPAARVRRVTA